MEYFAHIRETENGEIVKQTVTEHLAGTASRSAAFAAAFGAAEYGRLVGEAHDIGKNSDAFQRRLSGGPRVDHTTAGAIECAKLDEMLAALCVASHHGGLRDYGNEYADQADAPTFVGRLKAGFLGKIPPYDWKGTLRAPSAAPDFEDEFTLSVWVRMLHSCLVDADWLDTEAFASDGQVKRGGYDPLTALLERLEHYIAPWFPPKNGLNQKRCKILKSCLEAAKGEKGLYTLTVPTGGGKTVASLAFALRHAVEHRMQRIIYVIPYTSIIEQNAAVFSEILGEKNVIEHHSAASFDCEGETNQENYRKRLATENWDAPVIVTTAVQFFESFYASRNSKCRKLHNIANSVIIFDEAQMIPSVHMLPCVGVISNLVAHFGATAVLCTATQPVLTDLIHSFSPKVTAKEICPNTTQLYQSFRRVRFENRGKLSNQALAQELAELPQCLCIVNTRKAAQGIFELLPEEGCFHLSTLMYPAHRKEVLHMVRERLKKGQVCRVVSTSLIEAGVDVDFPTVYRELAGLDSILQAAGRCNREGKREAEKSTVVIFEGETTLPPLFRTAVGATRETLMACSDPAAPETIERFFSTYRTLIGANLDKYRVVEHLRNGISGCALPFKTVAQEFHFIEQDTKTVYIPCGGGAPLCDALLSGCADRETYRKAGTYSVGIYEQHYALLCTAGDIQPLDEGSAVLKNLSLYDPQTGLSMKADTGKALFI